MPCCLCSFGVANKELGENALVGSLVFCVWVSEGASEQGSEGMSSFEGCGPPVSLSPSISGSIGFLQV